MMKRFYQVAVISLMACASVLPIGAQEVPEEMYTLQEKTKIVVNEKYRATNTTHGTQVNSASHKLVATVPLSVGRYSYELKLYRLTDAGGDAKPGDFHIIRLFHGGNQLLEHVDLDGISEISTNSIFDIDLKKASAVPNKYVIVCPLAQDVTALIFEGHETSGKPHKVPVIVAKGDQAAVLLNRNLGIENILSANGLLEVNFVDSYQEYDGEDLFGNPVPTEWHPTRFRLFSTPAGSLKFQQIKEVQRDDLRSVGL